MSAHRGTSGYPHGGRANRAACAILDDIDMDQCTNEWLLKPRESLKNLYGVRIMHTYEKAPGSTRPKFRLHSFVRRHMLVRVDLLGVGTDENEPCENRP
jgi:hypothetical protein